MKDLRDIAFRLAARRATCSRSGIAVVAKVFAAVAICVAPLCDVALAATKDACLAASPMSPEVKLVDAYNAQFLKRVGAADTRNLKAQLSPYITDKTVLHEPISLPWGGTIIGFNGWMRLVQISDPVFAKIADRMDVSAPTYYQSGNVVMHELRITFRPKRPAEQIYATEIIEKYRIENGRIAQIDEFWEDTATLIRELKAMGAM